MPVTASPSVTCNANRVFSGLAPTPLGDKSFVIEQANRFPKLKILTSRKQSEMRSSGRVLGLEQAARALWILGEPPRSRAQTTLRTPCGAFGCIANSTPAQKMPCWLLRTLTVKWICAGVPLPPGCLPHLGIVSQSD